MHTLVSDVSSQSDVMRAESRSRVSNLEYDFPQWDKSMLYKVAASVMGITVETLERRLGVRK